MLTGVARRNCAAASNQWKSGRLRIISSIRSPAPRPWCRSPAAALAVRSAYSAAVHSSHCPGSSPRIDRSITRSGCSATMARKALGVVIPSTVLAMSSAGTQFGLVVVMSYPQ